MATKHRLELALAAIGILVLSGYSSCGEDILQDPGFDLWCGDQLCSWEVEEGSVERVATWHEKDEGASLVGERVAISQTSDITHLDVGCIYFSMIVDADPGATVSLELDFMDDGSAEYSHELPAEGWENIGYHITPPAWYQGVRFRIRKVGDERAVVAQLRAQAVAAEDCTSDALVVEDLPEGAECVEHGHCEGGVCAEIGVLSSSTEAWEAQTCGACSEDVTCSDGDVCGEEFGVEDLPYLACGEPARHVLGEACEFDDECSTGICEAGQCAECRPDADDCGEGLSCARMEGNVDTDVKLLPYMCSADEQLRASGEPCVSAGDCASGICNRDDDLRICNPTGRPCHSSSECSVYGFEGECQYIGAYDGVCE